MWIFVDVRIMLTLSAFAARPREGSRVMFGDGWQNVPVEWSSTRGRMLPEVSLLFAQRGYFGTSTRDIADAVRIRQPSLFHHFEAKHEIFRTARSRPVDRPDPLSY
jgi:AcrR family transcriptional regulator